MSRLSLIGACLLLLLTAACGSGFPTVPWLATSPVASSPLSTQPPLALASASPLPAETGPTASPTSTATSGPPTVRIWLPAQFDPNGASPAAGILKARLDAYAAQHREVHLDIRIKGTGDSASLLDALALTRSAAPEALPDLIALPRAQLEAAALKGALHSMDGLKDQVSDPDWYPYARESARAQDSAYGLPFAGDALAIVYHPSQFQTRPSTWDELFSRQKSLAFVGDEPDSFLVLDLYLSTGSSLLDTSNHPTLDQAALGEVLGLLQKGRLVPLQSDTPVWTAFVDGRANLALVWISDFLQQGTTADAALLPVPSVDGTSFTLGTTWSWALAGSDPQHDEVALDLAKWLIVDDFLAEWNKAAGYLSPRPNALNFWDDKNGTLDQISQSAFVIPGNDLLAAVQPVLHDALTRILNGDPPDEVARAAADALK